VPATVLIIVGPSRGLIFCTALLQIFTVRFSSHGIVFISVFFSQDWFSLFTAASPDFDLSILNYLVGGEGSMYKTLSGFIVHKRSAAKYED
jgi:hypothetical protein